MLVRNHNEKTVTVENAFAIELRNGWLCDGDDRIAALEEKVADLTLMVGKLIGMVNLSEHNLGQMIGHEWEEVVE